MKHIAFIFLFVLSFGSKIIAQESYFICDQVSVRLAGGSVILNLPKLTKNEIEKKIMDFIEKRKYVYKAFYSDQNKISFRDFALICNKGQCGSDLIAKNIFHLGYDKGFVKITLTNEIYTSYFGGELVINNNDDVASKQNIPFALYDFEIPEQYANEYPECIYTFNKKGKSKLKNPEVQKIILDFYNHYITDLKNNFEN